MLSLVIWQYNSFAQFAQNPVDRINTYDNDARVKGNVKSVVIRCKKLSTDEKFFANATDWKITTKRHNKSRSYTKDEYRQDGKIVLISSYDSLDILRLQSQYIYDSLNRLVEKKMRYKNGVIRTLETYEYDILNRWAATYSYDSSNKPFRNEHRIYKDNAIIVNYSDTSLARTIYTNNKNITTIETYLPNGQLYYKSEEIISRKDKITTQTHYNQNGEKWGIGISKSNDKEYYSKWKGNARSEFTEQTIKKNSKGDEVERITTGPLSSRNKKEKVTKITKEYIYDSNGNFISEIVYYNGNAAFEVTREIEYY